MSIATNQLPFAAPRVVAHLAWAVTRLRFLPTPTVAAWPAALVAATTGLRLQGFASVDVANVAWAIATLRYKPDVAWLQVRCHAMSLLGSCLVVTSAPVRGPRRVRCLDHPVMCLLVFMWLWWQGCCRGLLLWMSPTWHGPSPRCATNGRCLAAGEMPDCASFG